MHITLRIINKKGLHARASAKFVEVVENHDASAIVRKDSYKVTGDSIMGLLTLAATQDSEIEIKTTGREAKKLAEALEELVKNYFGEGS